MIFWDASAVLPLCVQETSSPLAQDLLLEDPATEEKANILDFAFEQQPKVSA